MRQTPDPVPPDDVEPADIARDLCTLAGWWHAVGDAERRDVAVDLAAELLGAE